MKEATLRRRVVQVLAEYGAFAVENPCLPGTPDVCTTLGWLELKVLRDWPKRHPEGLVRIGHFTHRQRLWLRRWVSCGGHAYVLIRIANDILLLDGSWAADHLGHTTKQQMLDAALEHWTRPGDMDTNIASAMLQRMP